MSNTQCSTQTQPITNAVSAELLPVYSGRGGHGAPLFCEAYGFRDNGPNERDKHKHGIYQKDLNGDMLDRLTPELVEALGIELGITGEE